MQRVRGAAKAACFSTLIALSALGAVSAQAQAPAAPVPSAPPDEASRVLNASFSWAAVSGAETYQLQISTAYNFATTVVNDSGFTTTTRNAGPFALSTVYFWRVRGKNASGDGAWSTIRTFTSPVLLPAPDSAGWIKVFRGTNTGDFFYAGNTSTAPGRILTPFPGGPYSVSGDTIKVTGSPAGQFYFKQPFSRYKVRYQIRFPNFTGTGNGGTGNCGMLLHVQAHDAPTMGFPRSVEAQGDPTQGMGQLWPIGDVWVTVKAKMVSNRMQYDTLSPEVDYGGANWNSRVVVGVNGWGFPTFASQQQDGWATMEAHVYGSDSIIHLVNGVERIRYRNPRVSSGGTVNNVSKMLAKGLIAWQSEGTAVWYRNLEIKPLPGDSSYVTSIAGSAPKAGHAPAANPRLLLNGSSGARIDVPGASGLYDLKGRNVGPRATLPGANEISSQEKNQ